MLLFPQRSKPDYIPRRHQRDSVIYCILSVANKSCETMADKIVEFISHWCKGRVRRHRTNRKSRKRTSFWRLRLRKKRRPQRPSETLTILPSYHDTAKPKPRSVTFHTSKFSVGIDSRASACMSDDPRDFVGKLTPSSLHPVHPFANERSPKCVETLSFQVRTRVPA